MSLPTNFPNDPEARLTALLLGELPDDEGAALRQEIARDPELAKLHERLSRTIGLVRQAATSVDEVIVSEPAPLKLSSGRRETLLKSFEVIRPASFAPWYRRVHVPRELVALAAMVMILAMLAAFVLVTSRERAAIAAASDYNGVVEDLYERHDATHRTQVAEETPVILSVESLNRRGQPQDLPAAAEVAKKPARVPAREADPLSGTAYYYSDLIREQKHKDETAGRAGLFKEKLLEDADSPWLAARRELLGAPAQPADKLDLFADIARQKQISNTPNGAQDREWNLPGLSASAGSPAATPPTAPPSGPAQQAGTSRLGDMVGDIAGVALQTEARKPQEPDTRQLDRLSRAGGGFGGGGAVGGAQNTSGVKGDTSLGYVVETAIPQDAKIPKSGWLEDGGVAAATTTGADTRYGKGPAVPSPANKPSNPFEHVTDRNTFGLGPRIQTDSSPMAPAAGATPGGGRIEVLRTNGSSSSVAVNFAAGDTPTGTHVAGTLVNGTNISPHTNAVGVRRYDMARRDLESAQKLERNGIYSVNAVGYVNVTNAAIDRSALAGEPLVINETMFNPPLALPPATRNFRVVLPELGEAEKKNVAETQLGLNEAGKSLAQTTVPPPVVDPATGLPLASAKPQEITFLEALEKYQDLSGRTVLRPNNLPDAKLRLPPETALTRDDWLKTLETVLSVNEIAMIPQGDKFVKAVPQAQAGQEAAEFKELPGEAFENTGRYVTEIVQIKNQSLQEVVQALMPLAKMPQSVMAIPSSRILVLRDTEENVKNLRALIDKIEAGPPVIDPATGLPVSKEIDEAKPKPTSTAPIPQPEIDTTDNAFSTFSLNVSDVSFKLAEASLQKGALPEAATIRSEEFINAFDYRDPEAAPGKPIAFAWDRARSPFAHNRDLLRFSIKTSATGRQAGKPVNLVLLLDNSGSMERADRVRIIQECLRVLAAQLNPEDRVSVVSFARTPRLWVDGLAGSQAAELPQRVGSLTPQGGTNLEEGMNLAYQTARRHFVAHGINRVVVLTDGAANLGNVEPQSLKQQVETHRKQGIALDCFGIGWEGYNDDLLEQLSRNGDGRYGFVNTPEAAVTEFASQLVGALQVAASDVKVQVEFNPKRVTSYRQIGYAKHQLQKEQFRDNTVDAAEIAAAEAGNALYAIQVNPRGEGPLAVVRVRYKTPGTTEYYEHEWSVPFSGSVPPLEEATPAIRLAGVAASFAEWLAASPFAAEVKPDALLRYLSGVPDAYGADPRPRKLETMIRQSIALAGSK